MGYDKSLSAGVKASKDPQQWRRLIVGAIVLILILLASAITWNKLTRDPAPTPTIQQNGDQNQGSGVNDGVMNQNGKVSK